MASNVDARTVPMLLFGDVEGKFRLLFETISQCENEYGPYEAAYCVGNFFGDDNSEWKLVKSGVIKTPIPCYVLGPCKSEHEAFFAGYEMELAPDVIYLGRKGILTTVSGLKVAYLSGVEAKGMSLSTFSSKDIQEIQRNFENSFLKGVDLLLTSQWPKDIMKGLPYPASVGPPKSASELISILAVIVKPCYHFAGLEGIFFKRNPYRNSKTYSDKHSHTTKFIGLSKMSNGENTFVFRLNHIPILKTTTEILKMQKQSELSTECPYQVKSDDLYASETQVFSRYDTSSTKGFEKRRRFQKKDSRMTQMSCWFCLRLPVESHLIVFTGQHCYISLAKGWLTKEHVLIVPNSHCRSTANLKEDVLQEICDFKRLLKNYFHAQYMHVVFYERNYKSPHLQIQVVPVPVLFNPRIEDILIAKASASNLTMKEIPPYSTMKQIAGTNVPYFCFEIEYVNQQTKKFFHKIEKEFPLLFPREVLADGEVLNVPHLTNWRDSKVCGLEEKYVCEKLKDDFMEFLSNY